MAWLEASKVSFDVPGRRILDGLDLAAEAAECLAVMGPSGSGKTSLLNCLCGVTAPSGGSVQIDGTELTSLGPARRSAFRLRRIGLVFQFGELLPEMTALENIALPLRLMGVSRQDAQVRAEEWLERVAVNERARAHPGELSGGEIQRVGIARALAHRPSLVLADEPTGALDEDNTVRVTELLVGVARELGSTVVITTHDPLVASRTDRVLRLRDGHLKPNEVTDSSRAVGGS